MELSYTVFQSPIGPLGIGWSGRGIRQVQLPGADAQETVAKLRRGLGEARDARPPEAVRRAMKLLLRHLDGEPQDFAELRLDLEPLPSFHRKVYEAARQVESGRTVTYGELAERVGSPGAARAVGQAMARNPFAIIVPCHRVVAAGGRPGGYSSYGGLLTKARLLEMEGASLKLPRSSADLPFDGDEALRRLKATDPKLGALIDRVGPLRLEIKSLHSPFASLAEAIVHQQLTGKAAATILGRFRALFPGDAFPTPRRVSAMPLRRLRSAGLSRAKAMAMKDLAAKVRDGTVPGVADLHRLSDDAIVERLTAVRGVGRWTVEMLLIFRLGRPDVLPIDDYGVRKGFARTFGKRKLPTPAQLEKHGQRWRPWRSVASWYLWRSLDT